MLEPNRTPKLNSIVQQMCRCTLYVVTALSFKQPFEFEFRARDQRRSPWYSDTRKSTVGRSHAYVHIRFHSLPSVSVIPVCPARSPKSHQGHWHPTGIWKGLSTLCGQCPHGLHARTPHVYACQWPPSYSQCPSYCLSAAPLPGPWSARQRPHRFERIVVTLVTDCVHVHTTGDCTRVACWWSTSNYPWGAWAASTPFHLLHQVQSPTSIDTRYMKDIRPGWQQWEIERFIIRQPPMGEKDDYDGENSNNGACSYIFFAWYKYVDTCRGGKIWIKRNQSKSMWY